MHRTKRAARNLAWQDSKNPFAKRWAYKVADPQSVAENGDASNLFRLNTDDPSDYPHHDPDSPVHDWNTIEHEPKHANTMPATSRRRSPNEPSDQIGEVPYSSSPAPSIKGTTSVLNEKDIEVREAGNRSDSDKTQVADNKNGDSDGLKHHSLRGWLQGTTTARKEAAKKDAAKDDNGKDKKPKKKFTFMSQIKATLFNSWINVLLIASPVGIALYYAGLDPRAVFVVNFVAIIPLAALLSYATEEIALRTGEVIGGLLNASFGNAVELIVSIIALTHDQILIVQTSLIGSILSNLLLVMGMCFFFGGFNRIEQAFNMTVAQTAASLLFLAVSGLVIPTVFNEWANTAATDKTSSTTTLVDGEAALSRATALMLLVVYACYLFFQLKSHAKMYQAPSEKNERRDFTKQKSRMKSMLPGKARKRKAAERKTAEERSDRASDVQSSENGEAEEREEPQLSIWVAIFTLCAATALVGVNAEYLVDSINAITCGSSISKTFVGLILLPIVGNAAEHATAVTVAIKDKMDLAIGVAVGSSMQIALLVLPLMVVLGWILGKDDMTLYFDGFQIAVLFVAVLLVNYLIQDGKSHWLEGVLLMILYIIIAVAAWYYPTDPRLADCPGS